MKQFIPNAVTPAPMKKNILLLSAILVVALIAVGIIMYSFDPYQSGFSIKFLFFTSLTIGAICLASLISIFLKAKFNK